jgi:hypothetical protein
MDDMINDQGDIYSAKTGGKMLKRADGSTSQRGLWDNIRAKAAANKKAGKKGKAPSKAILKAEASIESKKMGGNWLKESQELEFVNNK